MDDRFGCLAKEMVRVSHDERSPPSYVITKVEGIRMNGMDDFIHVKCAGRCFEIEGAMGIKFSKQNIVLIRVS